jgi:hypothetical protein
MYNIQRKKKKDEILTRWRRRIRTRRKGRGRG